MECGPPLRAGRVDEDLHVVARARGREEAVDAARFDQSLGNEPFSLLAVLEQLARLFAVSG